MSRRSNRRVAPINQPAGVRSTTNTLGFTPPPPFPTSTNSFLPQTTTPASSRSSHLNTTQQPRRTRRNILHDPGFVNTGLDDINLGIGGSGYGNLEEKNGKNVTQQHLGILSRNRAAFQNFYRGAIRGRSGAPSVPYDERALMSDLAISGETDQTSINKVVNLFKEIRDFAHLVKNYYPATDPRHNESTHATWQHENRVSNLVVGTLCYNPDLRFTQSVLAEIGMDAEYANLKDIVSTKFKNNSIHNCGDPQSLIEHPDFGTHIFDQVKNKIRWKKKDAIVLVEDLNQNGVYNTMIIVVKVPGRKERYEALVLPHRKSRKISVRAISDDASAINAAQPIAALDHFANTTKISKGKFHALNFNLDNEQEAEQHEYMRKRLRDNLLWDTHKSGENNWLVLRSYESQSKTNNFGGISLSSKRKDDGTRNIRFNVPYAADKDNQNKDLGLHKTQYVINKEKRTERLNLATDNSRGKIFFEAGKKNKRPYIETLANGGKKLMPPSIKSCTFPRGRIGNSLQTLNDNQVSALSAFGVGTGNSRKFQLDLYLHQSYKPKTLKTNPSNRSSSESVKLSSSCKVTQAKRTFGSRVQFGVEDRDYTRTETAELIKYLFDYRAFDLRKSADAEFRRLFSSGNFGGDLNATNFVGDPRILHALDGFFDRYGNLGDSLALKTGIDAEDRVLDRLQIDARRNQALNRFISNDDNFAAAKALLAEINGIISRNQTYQIPASVPGYEVSSSNPENSLKDFRNILRYDDLAYQIVKGIEFEANVADAKRRIRNDDNLTHSMIGQGVVEHDYWNDIATGRDDMSAGLRDRYIYNFGDPGAGSGDIPRRADERENIASGKRRALCNQASTDSFLEFAARQEEGMPGTTPSGCCAWLCYRSSNRER